METSAIESVCANILIQRLKSSGDKLKDFLIPKP